MFTDQKRFLKFTEGFLGMMFYAGILVLICLPWILKFAGTYFSTDIGEKYWPMLFTYRIAGLFSYVLSCVFEEAVRYKKENDLTI